ncbi:DUF2785 domain-containing protein [Virgibacillus siamensis]|uniref:DUF2785 domain-containing protein n=1 Tax=Virgibacillus siamensis TaxID=480071 RepID=UPI0009855B8A|nr:DUF2785 domain-containing protein [Virgibacillus siamensis]
MNKSFWLDVSSNNYKIPHGSRLEGLTNKLKGYLGSTDPTLRDEVAYPILSMWIERGLYDVHKLRELIGDMKANLTDRLGENYTDTVFLRSFSILILMEIIEYDNKQEVLKRAELEWLLDDVLSYFEKERDLRGYVPDKGWAHAIAHTADLFGALAGNRHIGRKGLERIVSAIADKVSVASGHTYLAAEDERLAYAVIRALRCGLIENVFFEKWLNPFAMHHGDDWVEHLSSATGASTYVNVKGFLRSLYFQILLSNNPPADADEYASMIKETIYNMDAVYYKLP